jgi:hypothetical protein
MYAPLPLAAPEENRKSSPSSRPVSPELRIRIDMGTNQTEPIESRIRVLIKNKIQ